MDSIITRHLLHMNDHEHIHRLAPGFQTQAQLLLERHVDGWPIKVGGLAIEKWRCTVWRDATPHRIQRPFEFDSKGPSRTVRSMTVCRSNRDNNVASTLIGMAGWERRPAT